jgi:hypothetical protein
VIERASGQDRLPQVTPRQLLVAVVRCLVGFRGDASTKRYGPASQTRSESLRSLMRSDFRRGRVFWTMSFLDLEFIGPGASTMYTFNVLCVLIIAVIAINLPHQPHRVRRVKARHVRF